MNMFGLLVAGVAFLLAAFVAIEFIGGSIAVIEDWKRAWRFYSVWFFAAVGVMPDAYDMIVASGLLNSPETPEALVWGMRFVAIGGIFARVIRQVRPPIPDDTDAAGA
jgi:hypothetical protein